MPLILPAPVFGTIDNFRDFGGFAGRYGRVQGGRLFRSAHLAAASDTDLQLLAGLGLSAVADLRRPAEREKAPNRLPQGFRGQVIRNDGDDRAEAPHIEFLRQGDLGDAAVERFLVGYYREAPFEPRHRDLFARTFAALAEPDAVLLVHCTAGKDRTGLFAALAQKALGAHEDDVIQDYLATNAAMMTPPKLARARTELIALTGADPSQVVLKGFLGVDSRHLQAAFAEIDQRSGGLEPFLFELGLDRPSLDRLRRNLIN
jgi:protein tyrosine/serine phosphatase